MRGSGLGDWARRARLVASYLSIKNVEALERCREVRAMKYHHSLLRSSLCMLAPVHKGGISTTLPEVSGIDATRSPQRSSFVGRSSYIQGAWLPRLF